MKNRILLITLLCSSLHFFGQQTYYTTGLGSGEFNDPISWTLTKGTTDTPVEAPSERDNIEINHYLSHFTEKNYTHYGNVTIGTSGTYEVITGLIDPGAYIFAGEVFNVSGTLITINDFHHQLEDSEGNGVLIFGSTSLIYINGDLVMNASGQAVLNNTSCGAGQTINDLHFKGVGARVCGSGTFIVPNKIRAWDAEGQEVRATQSGVEYIESLICNGFNFFQTSEACEATTPAPIMMGTGKFNIESLIIDFKANLENGQVNIDWATDRDFMNETFIIEKSYDRFVYEVVGSVNSEKKTTTRAEYTFIDDAKVRGDVYYRLKKISITGEIAYSQLALVKGEQTNNVFSISPNPSSGNTVHLRATGFDGSPFAILSIRSLLGQEMHREAVVIDSNGNIEMSLNHNLQRGSYLVSIISSATRVSQRLQIL